MVAANRDEFYDRPSSPPSIRTDADLNYLAPLDKQKGGTWIGMNEAGLFVALTNKLTDVNDPDAPSRGLLVRQILGSASTAQEALAETKSDKIQTYNPFLLMVIGPENAGFVSHRTEFENRQLTQFPVSFYLSNQSGLKIDPDHELLPSSDLDSADGDKIENSLEEFCGTHEEFMERESLCLHHEIAGTRSSSVLVLSKEDGSLNYRYSDGHPCEEPYQTVNIPDDFQERAVRHW